MKRFPIQGGLTITWAAAERAYAAYSRSFGTGQSLERLAERGGFGVLEFVYLYYEIPAWEGRRPTEYQIAQALADGDVTKGQP